MGKAYAMRPETVGIGEVLGTAAGYAAANALNDYLGVVWKTTGAGAERIDTTFATPRSFDTIALLGCTGAGSGWTKQVLAYDSAFANVYSEASSAFLAGSAMPAHGRGVALWEAPAAIPATAKTVRIALSGPAEPKTIGRIAIGTRLRLARNFSFGAGFGVRDLGRVDFSAQGNLLRRRGAKLRTVGLSFSSVHRDEVEEKVQPLIELAGAQEPILLVTDPDAHAQRQNRVYFGPLIGELGTIWRTAAAWEWRANLIDLVPIPKASG